MSKSRFESYHCLLLWVHGVSEFSSRWIFRTFPQVSASGWSQLAHADAALACFGYLYLKLTLMDTLCKSQRLNLESFAACSQASKFRHNTVCHINPIFIQYTVYVRGLGAPLPTHCHGHGVPSTLQTGDGKIYASKYIQTVGKLTCGLHIRCMWHCKYIDILYWNCVVYVCIYV